MDFSNKLLELMQQKEIYSFKKLSEAAGVSKYQIQCLRQGKIQQMRLEILVKISQALQINFNELIIIFSHKNYQTDVVKQEVSTQQSSQQITDLKKEYERLEKQLENQKELLFTQFQESSLQILESLLIQFPTAAQKARENRQLPAVNIIPLIEKPITRLLQEWGIEAVATVGAELPYEPEIHQLMEGNAQPTQKVKVRYTGYRQGDKLLYRAKVSPV
ncbi:helix-turn-helix transcriptional regulator [Plectonema cf. radiosum LEGE 06105]|uniref:Helix-turn-helix transcriptional regulator n=1 Tax=Plectonema cf. radiosum LEGE 06105 TaxID=945769 RepID=A0A8J7FDH0_9CYAN|nr:helix-turn-helix transcriptional regulator [Plectonema radiosum]MBE9216559.1 helix-turn-helix transcriptional regulator [Plectonema cf. radiosum LEGE 06105]